MSGLAVYVDGVPMPEEEARAFWQRFSDWMEDHRGDLLGFAEKEGFASVHPGVEAGRPVLHASRSAAQRPYAPASGGEAPGGSGSPRGAPIGGPPRGGKARKSGRKRHS